MICSLHYFHTESILFMNFTTKYKQKHCKIKLYWECEISPLAWLNMVKRNTRKCLYYACRQANTTEKKFIISSGIVQHVIRKCHSILGTLIRSKENITSMIWLKDFFQWVETIIASMNQMRNTKYISLNFSYNIQAKKCIWVSVILAITGSGNAFHVFSTKKLPEPKETCP